MKAGYIFCARYVYICICISAMQPYYAVTMPAQGSQATTFPYFRLSSSGVSAQRQSCRICSSSRMLVNSGIPAVVGNSAGQSTEAAATAVKIHDQGRAHPHFLKQGVLFDPNSLSLTSESEKRLALYADWLRMHPEIRTLVVGFCDTWGSEECTHELAQQRGAMVGQLLAQHGVGSAQIVGVKGWEKADPVCEAATPSCQEMNRRARIFIVAFGSVH